MPCTVHKMLPVAASFCPKATETKRGVKLATQYGAVSMEARVQFQTAWLFHGGAVVELERSTSKPADHTLEWAS